MLVNATVLPVTVPFVPFTVTTAVLLLVHAPPLVVELKLVFDPEQTLKDPVIVAGLAFTVTGVLVRQPVGNTYVIVDVPGLAPVTTPVVPFIVALPLLLLQVPPAGPELNAVVNPTHTLVVPVIVVGLALTVTVIVVKADPHDVLVSVKVIIVVPPLTPYTLPVVLPTVPIVVLLLLHVPVPPAAVTSLKVMVRPTQTLVVPVIVPAAGDTLTTTLAVVVAVPQNKLVTV